jgi:prepilin-type N-terminal cleavage/methylation domain-containing protein
MKSIPRLPLKRKAFTLVELIMTIIIVSIISIGLALMLSQHVEGAFYSEDLTTALNLARLEVEKVNNMSYANINSANFTNYEGYNYDLTRTVAYQYGNASSTESTKKVTVEVKKAGTSEVFISLVTYLAKNISYGL